MDQYVDEITQIKKRLNKIKSEQSKLDKLIVKQEEDGNYDDSLYQALEKLEDERNNLRLQLESLEKQLNKST